MKFSVEVNNNTMEYDKTWGTKIESPPQKGPLKFKNFNDFKLDTRNCLEGKNQQR